MRFIHIQMLWIIFERAGSLWVIDPAVNNMWDSLARPVHGYRRSDKL
jgi:hypothetical protein